MTAYLAGLYADSVLASYATTAAAFDASASISAGQIIQDEILPLVLVITGLVIGFLGHRFSRVICFLTGLIAGSLAVWYLFTHQTNLTNTGVPIVVGMLISISVAVMCLLLHLWTVSLFLAHGLALHLLLIDNGTFVHTTQTKLTLHAILWAVVMLYAVRNKEAQKQITSAGTAMFGALIAVLGMDQYTNKGLSAIAYQWTMLRYPMGVQSAVPRCEASCKWLTVTFFALFVLSTTTQLLLRQLEITSRKREKLVIGMDKQFTSNFNYESFTASQRHRFNQSQASVSSNASGTEPLLRAEFNYLDFRKLPMELQGLYVTLSSLIQQLSSQFGFQNDNVQNQSEHILLLLNNYTTRSSYDHITRLHNKLFSNYREWCMYLVVDPQLCSSRADRTTSELKLAEISLWLLIWGEASSLRHTPEALCYLYHNLSTELRTLESERPTPRRKVGDFMRHVITPLYDVIKNEKGSIETKRNYDDINEFFWSGECLETYYANEAYNVVSADIEAGGNGTGAAGSNGPSGSSYQQSAHQQQSHTPTGQQLPSIAYVLKYGSKTFLERRSWLQVLHVFYRLVTFYATAFHLLVCLALLNYQNVSWWSLPANHVLSSFVITLSGCSLLRELLDVWSTYGIQDPLYNRTIGFIVRITIKSLCFMYLTLFYIWSLERSAMYYPYYATLASVYILPIVFHVLATLFPTLSTMTRSHRVPYVQSLLKFWYPLHTGYLGRDVHEREGLTYKYQLFWMTLLAFKLFLSYHFQVAPLIRPSVRILDIASEVPVIRRWQAGADTLVLFVLWIPFILVYLFDTGIWYSVWQATAGVVVGMQGRIGEVRSFTSLISIFLDLPQRWDEKFMKYRSPAADQLPTGAASAAVLPAKSQTTMATTAGAARPPLYPKQQQRNTAAAAQSSNDYPAAESVGTNNTPHGDREHLLEQLHRSYQQSNVSPEDKHRQFTRFGVAWNAIADDLRNSDLISDSEKQLLLFRFTMDPTGQTVSHNLPLFLTAGKLDQVLDYATEIAAQHSDSSSTNPTLVHELEDQLIKFSYDPLRYEAVIEWWSHTCWLLENLLGQRHSAKLKLLVEQYTRLASNGTLLLNINLQNLQKVRSALLNLIRALRIAAASFASVQLHELEDDENDTTSSDTDEFDDESETSNPVDDASDEDVYGSDDEEAPEAKQQASEKPATPSSGGMRRSSLVKSSIKRSENAFSLKTMLKSPSVATLNMLESIRNRPRYSNASIVKDEKQRQYVILHVNLIRDQANALVTALTQCNKADHNQAVHQALKDITTDNAGFLWDDNYAARQIHSLMRHQRTQSVLNTLHTLLTVARIDAEPSNLEARRRLLFFGNSLLMDVPNAPSVKTMKSWSVLTPFYSEDVLYSWADLEKTTEDNVSVLFYLQTIYPDEWQNFLARQNLPEDISIDGVVASGKTFETRLWATARGQTLTRTADGMMLYEKALQLLASLEDPQQSQRSIHQMVQHKFQYVISCQVYGKQKRELDSKAADIEYLLHKYPSMRITYIDHVKSNRPGQAPPKSVNGHAQKEGKIIDEYYSVLIKSHRNPQTGQQEIREVYRILLPGNPVLGEGKPENQNHAMIFVRGEYIQTIDMNQASYMEEAFKLRNLLEEFDDPHGIDKPIGIVGCREQVYTGSLSSIAYYMAMQEGTFVSLGQRVLDTPLRVRLHYGHPDVFDKLWFIQRGGVSKASTGVNLSEDIFAGYNAVLRGSSVVMREYVTVGKGRDVGLQQLFKFEAKLAQGAAMQCLTRDLYRFSNSIDFFRLLSFFYGGTGFYIANSLTIWALIGFTYSRFFLSASHWEPYENFSGTATLSYWFGQMGFLYTLPILGNVGVERGFRAGCIEVLRMIFTGGPVYYIFHMGTKSHFFGQTILAGGAKYRPTGRGFVTRHESFSEIYRFHAASHFYIAFEILGLLTLFYYTITVGESYPLITWSTWLFVLSFLYAPVWFNPMAFDFDKVVLDYMEFTSWMRREEGDGDRCWKTWWREEQSYLHQLDAGKKFQQALLQLRHVAVGATLIFWSKPSRSQLVAAVVIVLCLNILFRSSRRRFRLNHQLYIRAAKAVLSLALGATAVIWLLFYQVTLVEVGTALSAIVAVSYAVASLMGILLLYGFRSPFIRQWFQMYDYCIGSLLMASIMAFSVVQIPSFIQTRLMFHNAFSRGVLIDQLLKHRRGEQVPQTAPQPTTQSDAAAAAGTPLMSPANRAVRAIASSGTHKVQSPLARATNSGILSSISMIERSPNKRLRNVGDNEPSPAGSPDLGAAPQQAGPSSRAKPSKGRAHFDDDQIARHQQQHGHRHGMSTDLSSRRLGAVKEQPSKENTPTASPDLNAPQQSSKSAASGKQSPSDPASLPVLPSHQQRNTSEPDVATYNRTLYSPASHATYSPYTHSSQPTTPVTSSEEKTRGK